MSALIRKLFQRKSVESKGATGGGVVDDTAAIAAALSPGTGHVSAQGKYKVGPLTLGGSDGLGGDKLMEAAFTTDDGITVSGAFTEFKNATVQTSTSNNFAVNILTAVGNIFENFANHINNIRVYGRNGIKNGGAETKIQNAYGKGTGNTDGGTFIDITNWDTSLHTVECEEYQTGIRTGGKGVQTLDAHLVRCGTGINAHSQGHPAQFVNTYFDTPRRFGMQFNDMSNASVVNAYVLHMGTPETASEALGFTLDDNSKNNNFMNVFFNQVTDTNYVGGFGFAAGSKNNLLVGIGGDYKLSVNTRARMRNQTVAGCHGGWARHNNLPRMNRAYASPVAVGEQVTLTFQLDWAYPAMTYNTLLFIGNYVSRTTQAQGAVGRFIIPIQFDDIGCVPVVEKLSGSPNNNWTIISASLAGDVLSVVVRNDSQYPGQISVELQRSLDATASTY